MDGQNSHAKKLPTNSKATRNLRIEGDVKRDLASIVLCQVTMKSHLSPNSFCCFSFFPSPSPSPSHRSTRKFSFPSSLDRFSQAVVRGWLARRKFAQLKKTPTPASSKPASGRTNDCALSFFFYFSLSLLYFLVKSSLTATQLLRGTQTRIK
jgi:hypothetical protein